jgi:peptidoglycan biosynthesis protein MviN/MurJ (putative lipid II flippase)
MMTKAEAQGWRQSRARGRRPFLVRETLKSGAFPFAVTLLVLWWSGRHLSISREFIVRMAWIGALVWLVGGFLFAVAFWLLQERRYRRRIEAEERGELPRTVGV